LAKLYREKIYIPDYQEGNNIYYYVREPGIKFEDKSTKEEYLKYLNFMEGTAQSIVITNYCYGAILLFDGAYSQEIPYNEKIHIKLTDYYVKSIESV